MDIGAAMNTPPVVNIHGHHHHHHHQYHVIRYFTTQPHKNVKTMPTRRGRFRDASASALTKEQKRIKQRLAVQKSTQKKKAQFMEMEEEIKRLCKENAAYTKLLNILSENQTVYGTRQLQRTLSSPI